MTRTRIPTLLLSPRIRRDFGDAIRAVAGPQLQFAVVDASAPLPPDVVADARIAFLSLDVVGQSTPTQPDPQMQHFCDQLLAAAHLQWLHVPTVGVDRPVFQELLRRGVRVTTSSGANAEAVAHTALMGVMVLARGGLKWMQAQREHRWTPLRGDEAQEDLRGQTAIVVGQGPIGRHIAVLLEALGLQVSRLRHSPQAGDAAQGIHGFGALPELAREANWLVVACPLTEATRHLVDARVMAALPRGAKIVNVGRGGVIDESALLDALASGQVGGAHLDVFAQEPLPADSPFWDLPNVLVSPHNAGSSRQYGDRVVQLFIDNLGRWTRGEPLHQEAPRALTLGRAGMKPLL